MMSSASIPSSGSVSEALAILAAVGDPKRSKSLLEDLATATEEHAKIRDEAVGRLKEVGEQSASLETKKSELNSREVGLGAKEASLQTKEESLRGVEESLAARETALSERESQHESNVKTLADKELTLDNSHATRMKVIEEQLSRNEIAHRDRMVSLDVREEALNEREKKLSEWQNSLQTKQVRLQKALEAAS